jgi:hypothetical protein
MSLNQYSQTIPKAVFKTTKIIHLALLGGQLMFAVLMFMTNRSTTILTDTSDLFLIVAPAIALGSFIASVFLYNQQITAAASRTSLSSKLTSYQTALIIRCALLEGASLFNIVCYFVTGNFLFLLVSFIIMIYFITVRPTINKVAEELNLTYEHKAELES